MSEIWSMTASDMYRLVRKRELSAVEIAESCLARYEEVNHRINAVCTLSEQVLEDARAADSTRGARDELPPLLGIPVGIKDVTPVAGLRTTFGSSVYADHVPTEDALVVSRLRKAGAIIFGKTNAPEFAAGGNTFNPVFGRTRNPWNRDLSAGGSTGGGAAGLSSGIIALAEGTDLGGSLRIPASFCGTVGLRPSPGLIPTWPSMYLWDDLQVTGPLARCVEDVARMLAAVAGPSRRSPICQPLTGTDYLEAVRSGPPPGTRVAYCRDIAGIGIDEDIEGVCRETVGSLAPRIGVEPIELDLSYGWKSFLALRGHWMVAHHLHHLEHLQEFGPNLRGNIEAGLETAPEELGRAEQGRRRIWEEFERFFTSFDFLLTPCMAVPPFPVEENYPTQIAGRAMQTYVDWIAPTFILSLTGLPVASVPCGLDTRGLPVGVQIVGPPRGEAAVLALASLLEKINPVGMAPL